MLHIFSGVKVLDLTKVFSGPFATRMLADYGAEVIKIESEKNYDDSRDYPPLKNGASGYYEILNRNKKGISLDLKNPDDLEKFYMLVKGADVFVENLTPFTKKKLKIEVGTLQKHNPRLIYASLSGHGQQSDRKYYDVVAQAESGLMSLSGEAGKPMKIGPSVVDAFSGMTLAFAIAGALFQRQKTNIGQFIDVSMFACAINLLESNLIDYSITKNNPTGTGNADNLIAPFGVYTAANGSVVIAVGNNALWEKLSAFLQKYTSFEAALFSSNQLRLQNSDALTALIERVIFTIHVAELIKQLEELGIPCSRVNTMTDVAANPQYFAEKALLKFAHPVLGDCIVPGASIKFSRSAEKELEIAPAVGQDNERYGI